jgi:hypothetical protein
MPSDRLLFNILGAIAQLETEICAELQIESNHLSLPE